MNLFRGALPHKINRERKQTHSSSVSLVSGSLDPTCNTTLLHMHPRQQRCISEAHAYKAIRFVANSHRLPLSL